MQIDEPYMQARPEKARQFGIEVLNRALQGVTGKTCLHICFGYAALIHERAEGYSFLQELADAACDQIFVRAPDCGMRYLPREAAFGKLQSMCEAARQLRAEYAKV